jgi:hypothetical protein
MPDTVLTAKLVDSPPLLPGYACHRVMFALPDGELPAAIRLSGKSRAITQVILDPIDLVVRTLEVWHGDQKLARQELAPLGCIQPAPAAFYGPPSSTPITWQDWGCSVELHLRPALPLPQLDALTVALYLSDPDAPVI